MQKKEKKPKKNRRNSIKYPNLYPNLNLKSRYEEIEDLYSYMDKLDEDCKAWLNKFSKEYINASFTHSKPFHNRKQQRELYQRNNERNRCLLTKQKSQHRMDYIDDLYNEEDMLYEDMTEEESDYKELVDTYKKKDTD